MKKTIASIGIAAVVSSVPVFPGDDMTFVSAALYDVDSFQVYVSATSTPTELTDKYKRIKSLDKQGTGQVAEATLVDSSGQEHTMVIPVEQYHQMGEVQGSRHNPTKREYESLIDKLKPDLAQAWTFDNSQWNTGSGATSYTFAYTTGSLSDGLMVLGANLGHSANFTSVTYNGVPATTIGSQIGDGASVKMRMAYLVAPASGTNNIVWTFSTTAGIDATVATYSGMAQTNSVNASSTVWDGTTTNQANYSKSLTTTSANTLVVWQSDNYSGDTNVTGSGGTTVRASYTGGAGQFGTILADEDAPSAGSITLTEGTGNSGSDWYGNILAAFNTASSSAAASEDIIEFFR